MQKRIYRCCNNCLYKDDSFYGCSKANVCYNGFSAYSPNVETRKSLEELAEEKDS